MLVLAINPGHDGAVAVIKDRRLVLSAESEKDSWNRHITVTPYTLLETAAALDEFPDTVVLGGWGRNNPSVTPRNTAGYGGAEAITHSRTRFFGKEVTMFSSSHVRSHIMGSVGMAPRDDSGRRAVLVWESLVGAFYLLNERFEVTDQISVMPWVGVRYNFLFRLADPNFPDHGGPVRFQDAGKLMALAAYGNAADADDDIRKTVDRILEQPGWLMKHEYRDTPLHNVGIESSEHKTAAALLTERIFAKFAEAAVEQLPRGIPLHVAGGCGLNCDWNFQWRELGHFSSVFVPPCANDSGSSLGHAIDAIHFHTGDPYIEWDVYAGREFDWDSDPDPEKWRRRDLDEHALAAAIGSGQIVGWVQGKWEIGPRALGNRSILAEPFSESTRDRLNEIKQREGYRPIAPCCRVEDLGQVFNETFEDPYMLYFRTVRSDRFGAITHVDGSARCQTVTESSNEPLHRLLSAFAEHAGVGVLCNTSLNFKRRGFINNMSDLAKYCESRALDGMVVGDAWFERIPS